MIKRPSEIYVHDETEGRLVYQGPEPELVPSLMKEFAEELCRQQDGDPIVVAAMAHLNLVMIHPFSDGNGRMARVLQTLMLGRDGILEPDFSSVEEWLGHNTEDYYAILAKTGCGAWNPRHNAHDWVRFNLRAHHMQAHTVRRRVDEIREIWRQLLELGEPLGLPDRSYDALVDAALGYRVQRPSYAKQTGVEDRTATRDLRELVDAGLLEARGQTRGRHYVAGGPIRKLHQGIRAARTPLATRSPT